MALEALPTLRICGGAVGSRIGLSRLKNEVLGCNRAKIPSSSRDVKGTAWTTGTGLVTLYDEFCDQKAIEAVMSIYLVGNGSSRQQHDFFECC